MSISQVVHKSLIELQKTLALAESCTGGHLSAKLTIIPNSSKFFKGSLVTYSNELKKTLLNVSRLTLLNHGAVSRETANEMLQGLMNVSQADYGIAVTGTAGPSDGACNSPVGIVFIAVGEKGKKPHIVRCHFNGNRKEIIEAACERALQELLFIITRVNSI